MAKLPTLLFAFAFVGTLAHSVFSQDDPSASIDFSLPGFSTTKPDSPYFVSIEGGYMVPYTERIPGTNAEFEMLPIPGGNFLMGSNESVVHSADELPQVQIAIEPFWMAKTEVTWKAYKLYMKLDRPFKEFSHEHIRRVTEATKIDAVSAPSVLYEPALTFDAGSGDRQPCATATQYAAKQYTKFVSLTTQQFFRLPTEAEWEYACRAGTKTAYYFGNDESELSDHAWHEANSDDRRHEVARLKPNPWGLYDMHGNVSEWVLDQYIANHYQTLDFETVTPELAFAKPTEVYPRVVRGGSFNMEADRCRSASRQFSKADWKDEDPDFPQSPWWHTSEEANGVGFRIIRPLNPPADRDEQEAFWKYDHPKIEDAIITHIENSGKGSFGIVDPELFKEIKRLNQPEKSP
jgi:formylglycine-generating enzyme required for sulfatase activity